MFLDTKLEISHGEFSHNLLRNTLDHVSEATSVENSLEVYDFCLGPVDLKLTKVRKHFVNIYDLQHVQRLRFKTI